MINIKCMFGIVRMLINFVVGVIEFLLFLRFIFKFFVVNAGTPFVAWLYGASAGLVSPFARILPDSRIICKSFSDFKGIIMRFYQSYNFIKNC